MHKTFKILGSMLLAMAIMPTMAQPANPDLAAPDDFRLTTESYAAVKECHVELPYEGLQKDFHIKYLRGAKASNMIDGVPSVTMLWTNQYRSVTVTLYGNTMTEANKFVDQLSLMKYLCNELDSKGPLSFRR